MCTCVCICICLNSVIMPNSMEIVDAPNSDNYFTLNLNLKTKLKTRPQIDHH